jgi:hypothetical protein
MQQEVGKGQGQGQGSGAPEKPLSAEEVTWAFRLLIGRDPLDNEIATYRGMKDFNDLRRALSGTWEFHHFYGAALDGKITYGMPLFLMRPPADTALPWCFEPPSLEKPVSQLCTSAQFQDAAFGEIVEAMGMAPSRTPRSWEQAWIVSVLATEEQILPGKQAIGFGVGAERIPSLLASRGVAVLATDKPPAEAAQGVDGSQLLNFYPDILPLEDFEQLVGVRPIDMNDLPQDLNGQFDFCWSASAVDRLGTPEKAVAFMEASLEVLRPGGLAVHTFALNIRSDTVTAVFPEICLLRRRDIEELARKLIVQGHTILPINLHPGWDAEDETVAAGPDGPIRLKKHYGGLIGCSFGFAIRKAS